MAVGRSGPAAGAIISLTFGEWDEERGTPRWTSNWPSSVKAAQPRKPRRTAFLAMAMHQPFRTHVRGCVRGYCRWHLKEQRDQAIRERRQVQIRPDWKEEPDLGRECDSADSAGQHAPEPRRLNMIEAINDALDVMLTRDPDSDRDGRGCRLFRRRVPRHRRAAKAKHGKTRVFDTPITECGIIGVAVGMGAYGLRPVPRNPVRRLYLPGVSTSWFQRGGAAALSFGLRLYLADDGAFAVRRRHFWRTDPQPKSPEGIVHPCQRASKP